MATLPAVATQEYLGLLPVSELKLHPKNARKNNVDLIAQSIAVNGFYGSVLRHKSSGYIIAGNGRLKGARKAGLKAVPVMEIDCDDATARRILLVDNRANDLAGYDDQALAAVLEECRNAGDFTGTGYEDGDLEALIEKLGNDAIDAGDGDGDGKEPGAPVIAYQLVFDTEEQQQRWYEFLRALKKSYPGETTIGARVVAFLDAHPIGG